MLQFKRILCVVEPETSSLAALRQALALADAHGAELTVFSVLKTDGAWALGGRDRAAARDDIERAALRKRDAIDGWTAAQGVRRAVAIEVRAGIEFIETVRFAVDKQIDLVIKCADDVDWLDRLFASDDMHLLRKCPCPVLMLKPGQGEGMRSVLATVDVGDELDDPDEQRVQADLNRKVLAYGAAIALAGPSELHVGSVWHAFAEDFLRYSAFAERSTEDADRYADQVRRHCAKRLRELIDELPGIAGVDAARLPKPRQHLVKGRPSQEIPRLAGQLRANLVVMGTVARTGIPGFIIGNTAEAILEQVQCSVLAIKPDGFVTPVLPA